MKLEVGMYVRTKDGEIGKIVECPEEIKESYSKYLFFETNNATNILHKEDIKKASHSLLGNCKEPCLIEEGDYVNGYPVKSKFGTNGVCLDINYQKQGIEQIVKEQDIKSIVTKEQFEAMKYEIK